MMRSVDDKMFTIYRGGVDHLLVMEPIASWVTSHGDRHLVLPEEHAILLPTADGFAVVDIDAL